MNSLVMTAAVVTSYFTGPSPIIEEEEEVRKEQKLQEPQNAIEQEKLMDENMMECLFEFLIECFN